MTVSESLRRTGQAEPGSNQAAKPVDACRLRKQVRPVSVLRRHRSEGVKDNQATQANRRRTGGRPPATGQAEAVVSHHHISGGASLPPGARRPSPRQPRLGAPAKPAPAPGTGEPPSPP